MNISSVHVIAKITAGIVSNLFFLQVIAKKYLLSRTGNCKHQHLLILKQREALQCQDEAEIPAKPDILSYSKVRLINSEINLMQTEIGSKMDSIWNRIRFEIDKNSEVDRDYLKSIIDKLEDIEPQDKIGKKGRIGAKIREGKIHDPVGDRYKSKEPKPDVSEEIKTFYKKRGPKPAKKKQITDIKEITPDALRKQLLMNESTKFWGLASLLTWAQVRTIAHEFSKPELNTLHLKLEAAKLAWTCQRCEKIDSIASMYQCEGKIFHQKYHDLHNDISLIVHFFTRL